MTPDGFQRWLAALGDAWEAGDADAAASLFSEDATYHEIPFDEPLRGRQAIRQYWSDVPKTQDRISFRWEILAVNRNTGIARWWASFVRIPQGTGVDLDGIFVVTFAGDGLCKTFQEWWHRRESATD